LRRIVVRGVDLGSAIIEIVTGFQDRSNILINLPTKRLSTKIQNFSVAKRIAKLWMTLRMHGLRIR
jgi:hypothetical protein